MQVVSLEPSGQIVWPTGTSSPRLAPGSVNMVDCQDQFLDMRAWPVDVPIENATVILYRCQVIFPDLNHGISTQRVYVDSAIIFPCKV